MSDFINFIIKSIFQESTFTKMMHKLHITPVALHFLRATSKGEKYINETHSLKADCNSIIIKPINNSRAPIGNIKDLLNKLKAILKKYRANNYRCFSLSFYGCPGLDTLTLGNIGTEIASHFKALQEFNIQFFNCNDLTDNGLQYFFGSITKNIKSLEKLSLSINCCRNIGDSAISHIESLFIRRTKTLKKLSLNFSEKLTTLHSSELVPFDPNIRKRAEKIGNCIAKQQGFKPGKMTTRWQR